MRKIRVLYGGSPFHAAMCSKEINGFNNIIVAKAEQTPSPGNNLWKAIPQLVNADIYHGIYWENCWKNFFGAKLLGKKIVCDWIGTDVYRILKDKKRRLAMKILDNVIDVHLAGSPGLVDELKQIGIKALRIPHVQTAISGQVSPMPASPMVLSYIPDTRRDFYRASLVHQLAEEFSDVKFVVVWGTGTGIVSPPNLTYLGIRDDMEEIYRNSTVLLRIVEHDGQSLMVREALAMGRQVIWSEPFPHCHYAKDFEAARAALSSIIKNPVVNYDGANYVRETFDKDKVLGSLVKIYQGLLGGEK